MRLKKALPRDIKEGSKLWYKEEREGVQFLRKATALGINDSKRKMKTYLGYPTYISENGFLSSSYGAYVEGRSTISDCKEWAFRWIKEKKRVWRYKISRYIAP